MKHKTIWLSKKTAVAAHSVTVCGNKFRKPLELDLFAYSVTERGISMQKAFRHRRKGREILFRHTDHLPIFIGRMVFSLDKAISLWYNRPKTVYIIVKL